MQFLILNLSLCGNISIIITLSTEVKSWKIIQKEIKEYGADLKEKECITVLTKTDALLDELNDEIEHNLKKAGVTEVIRISSITGKGLKSLLGKVSKIIVNYDKSETNISHVH